MEIWKIILIVIPVLVLAYIGYFVLYALIFFGADQVEVFFAEADLRNGNIDSNWYYDQNKTKIYWVIRSGWTTKYQSHEIKGVDVKTFQVLSKHYAKDKHKAYFEKQPFFVRDIQSFKVIPKEGSDDSEDKYHRSYAIDKFNAYFYIGKPVEVDVETFEVLSYKLAIDKNSIYFRDKKFNFPNATKMRLEQVAGMRVMAEFEGKHYLFCPDLGLVQLNNSSFPLIFGEKTNKFFFNGSIYTYCNEFYQLPQSISTNGTEPIETPIIEVLGRNLSVIPSPDGRLTDYYTNGTHIFFYTERLLKNYEMWKISIGGEDVLFNYTSSALVMVKNHTDGFTALSSLYAKDDETIFLFGFPTDLKHIRHYEGNRLNNQTLAFKHQDKIEFAQIVNSFETTGKANLFGKAVSIEGETLYYFLDKKLLEREVESLRKTGFLD